MPDKEIFEETVYDYDILKQRLREMAFLTKNIKIVLRDDRPEEPIEKTFHYEGGIKEFVTYLNMLTSVTLPKTLPSGISVHADLVAHPKTI